MSIFVISAGEGVTACLNSPRNELFIRKLTLNMVPSCAVNTANEIYVFKGLFNSRIQIDAPLVDKRGWLFETIHERRRLTEDIAESAANRELLLWPSTAGRF